MDDENEEREEPGVWYEADTDLMGDGYHTCGHHHRTRKAAQKCLPTPPRNRPGSLTQYFSMAQIRRFEK